MKFKEWCEIENITVNLSEGNCFVKATCGYSFKNKKDNVDLLEYLIDYTSMTHFVVRESSIVRSPRLCAPFLELYFQEAPTINRMNSFVNTMNDKKIIWKKIPIFFHYEG